MPARGPNQSVGESSRLALLAPAPPHTPQSSDTRSRASRPSPSGRCARNKRSPSPRHAPTWPRATRRTPRHRADHGSVRAERGRQGGPSRKGVDDLCARRLGIGALPAGKRRVTRRSIAPTIRVVFPQITSLRALPPRRHLAVARDTLLMSAPPVPRLRTLAPPRKAHASGVRHLARAARSGHRTHTPGPGTRREGRKERVGVGAGVLDGSRELEHGSLEP